MTSQDVLKEMKITLKTQKQNMSIKQSTSKFAQKQQFEKKIYKIKCVDMVSGFGWKSIYKLSGAI